MRVVPYICASERLCGGTSRRHAAAPGRSTSSEWKAPIPVHQFGVSRHAPGGSIRYRHSLFCGVVGLMS
eukprot:scaffold296470_cov31-Tisochrysis_lutea.AAC.1